MKYELGRFVSRSRGFMGKMIDFAKRVFKPGYREGIVKRLAAVDIFFRVSFELICQ